MQGYLPSLVKPVGKGQYCIIRLQNQFDGTLLLDCDWLTPGINVVHIFELGSCRLLLMREEQNDIEYGKQRISSSNSYD